jgi:hypothetical protein
MYKTTGTEGVSEQDAVENIWVGERDSNSTMEKMWNEEL